MSGAKDMALTLIKIGAAMFPPLADLLADAVHALDPTGSSDDPLVKQVRAILPERSLSEDAAAALDALTITDAD